MSICIIGDQHGNTSNFIKLIKYIEDRHNPSCYIQVGDFGVMGFGFQKFLKNVSKTIDKPLYFIDGNHENHKWLSDKIEISPNVYYLHRGSQLRIEDKNILLIGGAISTDRSKRKLNKNWWLEENSKEEIENTYTYNKIDIFVSHESIDYPLEKSYYSSKEDYREAVELQDSLRELFKRSGAKIAIHGHHHTFYKKDLSKGRIEYGLGCDNQSFDEQYIIL